MRFRSVLFAPASEAEMIRKMPRSSPDCVVLDLEDAVAADAKAEAREVAAASVAWLRREHPHLTVFVRVNSPVTEYFPADLGALPADLDGVMVPKIESGAQRAGVVADVRAHGHEIPIFVGVETVAGVLACGEILASCDVVAVYFGAEDYVADLGGLRTREGTEVLCARSMVAMWARRHGVVPVDQIVASFRDEALFIADAATGRSLGYRGKMCIHPSQVELARRSFSPSLEELARARRMVDSYAEASRLRKASIAFEGQMVDEPLVAQARALLALADE